MEWKNITIKKYIALYKAIEDCYSSEEDKQVAILSAIHNKPIEYFEALPIIKLKKLIEQSQFIYSKPNIKGLPKSIIVNGKRYLINVDMSDKNSGQYIDFTHYCKDEKSINLNYHNLLSLLASPSDWLGRDKFKRMEKKAKTKDELILVANRISEQRREIANEFLEHLTMDKVFQISGFFLLLFQNLTNSLLDYSEKKVKREMKIANKLLRKVIKKDLRNIGAGL